MPTMTAAPLIQRLPAHTHDWRETHLLSRRSLAGMCDMYFLFIYAHFDFASFDSLVDTQFHMQPYLSPH